MALSADETFSAPPTASYGNRARQGSLLLSIYGYAPCYGEFVVQIKHVRRLFIVICLVMLDTPSASTDWSH